MKKLIKLLILIILSTCQLNAQTQFDYLKQKYDSLMSINNNPEALKITKQMNQWALENEGDTSLNYAVSFRYIGYAYKDKDSALFYFHLSNRVLVNQNRQNHVEYGITCTFIGKHYLEENDSLDAVKYYLEAENVIRKSLGENTNGYLSVIISIYEMYKNLNNYDEANKYILKSYDILLRNNQADTEIYQAILKEIDVLIYKETILGISSMEKNENSMAEERFLQIKNIFIKIKDTTSLKYADLCNNSGLNYFYMGIYNQAKNYLNKSKEIYELNNDLDNNGYPTALNNIGIVLMNMNDYKNAEINFKQVIQLTNKIDEKNNNVRFLAQNNLGVINLNLRNYVVAKNYFFANFTISNNFKEDKSKNYALSCLNISAAYNGENKLDSAVFYISRAIQYYEKARIFDANLGLSYNNLGAIYLENKDFNKAKTVLIKTVDYLKKANASNINQYALALTNLGLVYDELGNYDLSKYNLENAYDIILKYNLDADQNLYCQGALAWHSKNYAGLYSIYHDWLTIKSKKLLNDFTYLSPREKFNYWNHENKAFYDILNFSSTAYSNMPKLSELSYNSVLLIKSLFLDNENDFVRTLRFRNDTNSISSFNKIKELKDNLVHPDNSRNKPYLESIKNQIDSINKLLVLQIGEYAALKRRFELRWTDVRNNLKNNESAIEFSKYYDSKDSCYKYMAQLLRPSFEYPHIVKLGSEKEIEKYKAGNGLSELYRLVWKPIDSLLQGVETVYYSPDGMLYSVPFHALCMNDSAGCNYLMDKYTLHQLSTTRYLADSTLINTKPLNNSIALYGGINYDAVNDTTSTKQEESNEDFILANTLKRETTFGAVSYLPGTKQEVESVVPLFNKNKWNTTIATGSKASEQLFKSYSDTLAPSIIHIATHGFAFPDKEEKRKKNNMDMLMLNNTQMQYTAAEDPMMRCGLMFAGANKSWTGKQKEMIEQTGQDGILTAAEVANMDLSNTKLVVLSACETGLGKVEGSEGVFGLQRGFKLAGVEQLIVSLWKVPDRETMELMNLFYTDLTITKDPVVSFSKAQKQMRNNYPDNPEKWAGFVLVR